MAKKTLKVKTEAMHAPKQAKKAAPKQTKATWFPSKHTGTARPVIALLGSGPQ